MDDAPLVASIVDALETLDFPAVQRRLTVKRATHAMTWLHRFAQLASHRLALELTVAKVQSRRRGGVESLAHAYRQLLLDHRGACDTLAASTVSATATSTRPPEPEQTPRRIAIIARQLLDETRVVAERHGAVLNALMEVATTLAMSSERSTYADIAQAHLHVHMNTSTAIALSHGHAHTSSPLLPRLLSQSDHELRFIYHTLHLHQSIDDYRFKQAALHLFHARQHVRGVADVVVMHRSRSDLSAMTAGSGGTGSGVGKNAAGGSGSAPSTLLSWLRVWYEQSEARMTVVFDVVLRGKADGRAKSLSGESPRVLETGAGDGSGGAMEVGAAMDDNRWAPVDAERSAFHYHVLIQRFRDANPHVRQISLFYDVGDEEADGRPPFHLSGYACRNVGYRKLSGVQSYPGIYHVPENGLAFQDHLPNIISIMQLSTDTLHSWSFRASHATNTAQHPSGIVAFYDTKIQTTYVLAQCSPRIYIALVAEGRCERDAVVLGFVGEVARALRNEEVLHVWRAASV